MKKIILIIIVAIIIAVGTVGIGRYFISQKFKEPSLRDKPTFDHETGKEMF